MKFSIGKIFLIILLITLLSVPAYSASKSTEPEFAQSGVIGGTKLRYENLFVNKHGIVTVTIHNPTTSGMSFNANFSFIDKNGNHLTGFTASGYAEKYKRVAHFYEVDYSKFKKAVSVKVLGRSGRTGD